MRHTWIFAALAFATVCRSAGLPSVPEADLLFYAPFDGETTAVVARGKPETRRSLLHSYGYCLVHDVDIHESNRESRPLRETIWAAQDALGWDEDVVFHPYWENDVVKRLGDDIGRIMASAYTRGGRMILAVLSDTDAEREVTLALDLGALGMAAGGTGSDLWDPDRSYVLGPDWRGLVPPRGFRMILWK